MIQKEAFWEKSVYGSRKYMKMRTLVCTEFWQNFDRTLMWKIRMVRSLADRAFRLRRRPSSPIPLIAPAAAFRTSLSVSVSKAAISSMYLELINFPMALSASAAACRVPGTGSFRRAAAAAPPLSPITCSILEMLVTCAVYLRHLRLDGEAWSSFRLPIYPFILSNSLRTNIETNYFYEQRTTPRRAAALHKSELSKPVFRLLWSIVAKQNSEEVLQNKLTSGKYLGFLAIPA